ncbi:MAG: hypothetical protein BGO67_07205 [Alphaproteobacteria bacterium 41-28]|nr:MAG: hypothetical protein BGO67_07205 [Alphaproteobacteria bacterium 41-28]
MLKKYTFYKITAFAFPLFLSIHSPVHAMNDDTSCCEEVKVPPKSFSMENSNKKEEETYNAALNNLKKEKYDAAFRDFLETGFHGAIKVEDFNKNHVDKDYMDVILQGFGYHPNPLVNAPEEKYQRRYAAVGYVYALVQSNEGLKTSPFGKAIAKCMDKKYHLELISYMCPEGERSEVQEKSKGWKLSKI